MTSADPFSSQLLCVLRVHSADSPYRKYCLFTYSSDLDQVLAQYPSSETPEHLFSGLRRQDERLLLRFTDGYCYLDRQLEATDSLQPLPETVRAAITTEPEWAGCYDFSQDEQTFYYLQNKQELWCYEASTQTSRQLFQRANLDFNGSYGLFQLQLTDNEQLLVMTLYTARHRTGGHPEDMTCALVRIDLQSPAAETLLTTKAADITPLAITDEGQVLFNYQFEQVYGTGISR